MDKCEICSREWQERYRIACQRFDRALNIAVIVTIAAVCVALVSVVLAAACLAKTIGFINGFEYVEEETTIVSQDGEGQNIAVLVDTTKEG